MASRRGSEASTGHGPRPVTIAYSTATTENTSLCSSYIPARAELAQYCTSRSLVSNGGMPLVDDDT